MDTSQRPLVSVIIPLYNHERFIVRCLESIVEDSYPIKEIIVLDDGSTDASAEMVQKWYLNNSERFVSRFKFIRRENRGLTKTLNELVSMAQGEYIVPVASDDYLLPGGIQARLEYLLDHPEKLAVFADCIVVDGNGGLLYNSGLTDLYQGRKKYLAHERLRAYELIFHWCIPGPVLMAKRDVYQVVGGYDESLFVEDWDFFLRLLSHNLLGFVDYPVAAYRLHGLNSVTNKSLASRSNDSKYKTISKNLDNFSGLKRAHIITKKISLIGAMNMVNGNFLKSFFYRGLGFLLRRITTIIYDLEALILLRILKNE
ncbi:MAG: Chondroitin synthase [Pelotomaculum sp. PtaB.Bin104]|nr:MAG: Chondroitin synthase [Pelotomaculum sp. PtaB.Bin104]